LIKVEILVPQEAADDSADNLLVVVQSTKNIDAKWQSGEMCLSHFTALMKLKYEPRKNQSVQKLRDVL